MIPSQGDEHPCPEDDHQLQLAYFYREPQISDFWFLMLKIPECCDVQIRLGLTIWCWHHVIFIFFSYFSHIFPWWVPYFPMVFFRVFHNDRGPGALVLLPTRELASQARLTGLTAVFFLITAKSGNHTQHGWITWIDEVLFRINGMVWQ